MVPLVLLLAVVAADAASPSREQMEAIRKRVGRHGIWLVSDGVHFEARHPRFDDAGVSFAPNDLHLPYWQDTTGTRRTGRSDWRGMPESPIGWDRIDEIAVRKPNRTRGAIVGGLLGLALGATVVGLALSNDRHIELGMLVLPFIPPAGALAGGLAGGLVGAPLRRSEIVWRRSE